ncbi:BrnA antitoxin family protein [Erwinia sp. SLM-02]|uniref:BrnA antitoxin family protein n=1 Tax=Erwinia sp. SLM-02 TaxID=3020057 RepID=UPI0028D874CD|nr:BrnA antitoxin family protein [uncultured Erwinia sp.]
MVTKQHQIDRLLQLKDEDINCQDAPVLSDNEWATAERGRFYRPRKVQKTIRIDADVIHWLESQGPGYQTRINKILREAMISDIK